MQQFLYPLLQPAPALPEGGLVDAEAPGDFGPLDAAAAECDQVAFFLAEGLQDAFRDFVVQCLTAGGGRVVRGDGGAEGIECRGITDSAAAFECRIVPGEFSEFGLDHALEIGGEGGGGVKGELALGGVVDEALGDALADVHGFAMIPKAIAHANPDEDRDQTQEFGIGAFALGGVGPAKAGQQ